MNGHLQFFLLWDNYSLFWLGLGQKANSLVNEGAAWMNYIVCNIFNRPCGRAGVGMTDVTFYADFLALRVVSREVGERLLSSLLDSYRRIRLPSMIALAMAY